MIPLPYSETVPSVDRACRSSKPYPSHKPVVFPLNPAVAKNGLRFVCVLLQELFVEEMVAAVDAVSRDSLSQVVRVLLGSLPATLTTSTVNAMGPLRGLLLPVPTPVELLSRWVSSTCIKPAHNSIQSPPSDWSQKRSHKRTLALTSLHPPVLAQ